MTVKTKLKLVGSKDGGANCIGCFFSEYRDDGIQLCHRPDDEVSCVQHQYKKGPRWAIFVEDTDEG